MTGLLWLPSRPQSSFKIPHSIDVSSTPNDSNLYLIPLGVSDILVLYHTQIIQLDSDEFIVKEEIFLEAPIVAFKFDPASLKLTLKISKEQCPGIETDIEAPSRASDCTDDIVTITSKNCTWSFDCPLRTFVISFSTSGSLNCTLPSDNNLEEGPQAHQSVLEVIKNDHVASLAEPTKLQLLLKSDRSIVSSVIVPESFLEIDSQSLVWINGIIFVFGAANDHFQILKYSLIQSASPTNVTRLDCDASMLILFVGM